MLLLGFAQAMPAAISTMPAFRRPGWDMVELPPAGQGSYALQVRAFHAPLYRDATF